MHSQPGSSTFVFFNPRIFMAARATCNATTAQALSGQAQAIQRVLLKRNTQKPMNLRRSLLEPTSQAAVTDAAKAGHCNMSIHSIDDQPPCCCNVCAATTPSGVAAHTLRIWGSYALDAISSTLWEAICAPSACMSSFVLRAFGNISFSSSLTWCLTNSPMTLTLASYISP